jgi:hypothetical protein
MNQENAVHVTERDLYNLFKQMPSNLNKNNSPNIYRNDLCVADEEYVDLDFSSLIMKLFLSSRVQKKYSTFFSGFEHNFDPQIIREILDIKEVLDIKRKRKILSEDVIFDIPFSKYRSYVKHIELIISYNDIFSFFLGKKSFSYDNKFCYAIEDKLNQEIDLSINNSHYSYKD